MAHRHTNSQRQGDRESGKHTHTHARMHAELDKVADADPGVALYDV